MFNTFFNTIKWRASLFGLTIIVSFTTLADTARFDCGSTPQAKELALRIATDPKQMRTRLVCNPALVKIAEEKAEDMASRGLVSHFLGGSPNTRIRDAGLVLPEYYGDAMSNQVEALAGGYKDADDVWFAFKTSYSHKIHLLAELPFYQEQDQIGVAFFKDYATPHVEYWAIYLTKLVGVEDEISPNKQVYMSKKKKFDDIPDKGLGIITKDGEVTFKPNKTN